MIKSIIHKLIESHCFLLGLKLVP